MPGFYDDVVALTEEERAMLAKVSLTEAQFMEATGVPAVWGEPNYTIRERVSARPTLDINGLWSGYSGPGPTTIIPVRAGCKISSRLVGNQDASQDLRADQEGHRGCDAADGQGRGPAAHDRQARADSVRSARDASRRARVRARLGHTPVFTRGGGSIPIVAELADLLKIPVVMMGYGLDTDGLHSPNEHYRIDMFHRGIETAIVYLDELAQLPSVD